jgi:hypothetical protein
MTWLGLPVIAFLAAAVAHCIIARIPGTANTLTRFLCVGGAIGLLLIAVMPRLHRPAIPIAAGVMLYAVLCDIYIFLFSSVTGSLSAGILMDLLTAGAAWKPDPKVGAEMTRRRIETLKRNGFLAGNDESLVLTPKGQATLRNYRALRRFFRHVTD